MQQAHALSSIDNPKLPLVIERSRGEKTCLPPISKMTKEKEEVGFQRSTEVLSRGMSLSSPVLLECRCVARATHDQAIDRFGFCVKCKRLKGQHANDKTIKSQVRV